MKKVFNQIILNIILVFVSALIIFMVKVVVIDKFSMIECLGSDIVFTILTSLTSTVGWRWLIEGIKATSGYNCFIVMFIAFCALLYGLSISYNNNAIRICIAIACALFMICSASEYIILWTTLKKSANRIEDQVGHKK